MASSRAFGLSLWTQPDNVLMMQSGGYLIPVLTDFGMALDCAAEDCDSFQLPFNSRHVGRGGATHYLPHEIRFTNPGRDVTLDYSKSDQFGVGLTLW